ncbi:CAX-interacting protein 4-like [Iris pallida]|uniref:CAX-interacting protein 4-like n=1 Tax=Iris pallida TaxID=29817 RepID=A0AAX6DHG8_IRIPA|nr:CAX-interacting protein 4-like [Iris pallida]
MATTMMMTATLWRRSEGGDFVPVEADDPDDDGFDDGDPGSLAVTRARLSSCLLPVFFLDDALASTPEGKP